MSGTTTTRNHGDAMAMTTIVLTTEKNVSTNSSRERGMISSIVYISYEKKVKIIDIHVHVYGSSYNHREQQHEIYGLC